MKSEINVTADKTNKNISQETRPQSWVAIGIGLLIPLGWPALLLFLPLSSMKVALVLLSVWLLQLLEFVLVWYRCGSERMPFFSGLGLIASESNVFSPIGIFIYMKRILWIYVLSFVYTCFGIFKERLYTQEKYYNLIQSSLLRIAR